MGLQLEYQAIPADSGFVELVRTLARENSADVEMTLHAPYQLQQWARANPGSELEAWLTSEYAGPIGEWCQSAVARYPGIETRHFFVGKAVDWWKFALSSSYRDLFRATTRGAPQDEDWIPTGPFDSLVRTVFLNADPIAPGADGVQGCPVQYITPNDAIAFGEGLKTLDPREAAAHLSELRERYRAPLKAPDGDVNGIKAFQDFWARAAKDGDGVLAVYD